MVGEDAIVIMLNGMWSAGDGRLVFLIETMTCLSRVSRWGLGCFDARVLAWIPVRSCDEFHSSKATT